MKFCFSIVNKKKKKQIRWHYDYVNSKVEAYDVWLYIIGFDFFFVKKSGVQTGVFAILSKVLRVKL